MSSVNSNGFISPGSDAPTAPELLARVRRHLDSPTNDSLVEVIAINQALDRLGHEAPSHDVVECYIGIAQFFNLAGRNPLGLAASSKAVAEAKRLAPVTNELRRAHTIHAVSLLDAGNHAEAIEHLAEALQVAIELKDRDGRAAVLNNIGVSKLFLSQYTDAIRCFEAVMDVAAGSTRFGELAASALSNIALACVYLGEHERGVAAATAAVEHLKDPICIQHLTTRVNAETHLVRHLSELGRRLGFTKVCFGSAHASTQANKHSCTRMLPSVRS